MFWKMCSRHLRLSVDPYCRSTFINLSIDILINVLVDPWSTPDRHSFDISIDKIDSASILDGVSVKISWHLSNCQLRCWSSVGWVSIEMLIKGWKRLRISSWLRVPWDMYLLLIMPDSWNSWAALTTLTLLSSTKLLYFECMILIFFSVNQ